MPNVNTNKRWVRILRKTENDFIEFEFFVADKDLFVELILPEPAFKDFCASNRVVIVEQDTHATAPASASASKTRMAFSVVK